MSYSELFDKSRPVPSSLPYEQVRPLIKWTYAWMGIGLLVTAIVAFIVATSPALVAVRANPVFAIGAMVGQFILVIALSFAINRISPGLAAILFLVYAATMGFSLSLIFLVFSSASIVAAFATTAILFGIMSVVGFTTNTDLTKFGRLLMFALIGIFIAMIINIFLGSGLLTFVISALGVLIFMGLTAYDTQNLKRMASAPEVQADPTLMAKISIFGALSLYLNFINIFLFLLQLMGGSSNE